MVRAYLKRRSNQSSAATFDEQGRFTPDEATFTAPPAEPGLLPGDVLAGFEVAEELPALEWRKYLAYRTLAAADFEGATLYELLERRTYPSEAGGVFEEWAVTGATVRAISREVEDEPSQQGGVEKRHRVLELTLEGALELNPTLHRLAANGFEYLVLEGRAFTSYATAKVKEVERGYVGDPNASPAV